MIDIEEGAEGGDLSVCLGDRGAAPPEHCGGPTGYRLMLKRQEDGPAMSDRLLLAAGIELFALARIRLRSTLDEGFRSIDRRLQECGPLQPERFSLSEANERLAELQQGGRLRP